MPRVARAYGMAMTNVACGVLAGALAVLAAAGCAGVRRELTVESDPPGALVYLNGDEVGRTPVTREFLYYGTMDLRLRKDGYRTLEARPRVWAPLWQVPPIDLLAEAFPLTDRHRVSYKLKPEPAGEVDKAALIDRAADLSTKLESGQVRTAPTTREREEAEEAEGTDGTDGTEKTDRTDAASESVESPAPDRPQ